MIEFGEISKLYLGDKRPQHEWIFKNTEDPGIVLFSPVVIRTSENNLTTVFALISLDFWSFWMLDAGSRD